MMYTCGAKLMVHIHSVFFMVDARPIIEYSKQVAQ